MPRAGKVIVVGYWLVVIVVVAIALTIRWLKSAP
jgi:hypothetical protein